MRVDRMAKAKVMARESMQEGMYPFLCKVWKLKSPHNNKKNISDYN